jgi:hypothetical protein
MNDVDARRRNCSCDRLTMIRVRRGLRGGIVGACGAGHRDQLTGHSRAFARDDNGTISGAHHRLIAGGEYLLGPSDTVAADWSEGKGDLQDRERHRRYSAAAEMFRRA